MANDDLERAVAVAARAFDGRVDRQGQPYIAHAIRVTLDVEGDDERAVAMLHDVFEWGTVTLREFHSQKFPKRIIDAVDSGLYEVAKKNDDFTPARSVEEALSAAAPERLVMPPPAGSGNDA